MSSQQDIEYIKDNEKSIKSSWAWKQEAHDDMLLENINHAADVAAENYRSKRFVELLAEEPGLNERLEKRRIQKKK